MNELEETTTNMSTKCAYVYFGFHLFTYINRTHALLKSSKWPAARSEWQTISITTFLIQNLETKLIIS